MTRDEINAMVLAGKGVGIDWAAPVREAAAAQPGDDAALIVRLLDGRHAFIHLQPETGGLGMTVAGDVTRCEESARIARVRGRASSVAARLGLTPAPGGGVR